MKPTDKIDDLMVAADLLISFMAKMDALNDKESRQLAEWIKAREPECLTEAEKSFLLAARTYVLDYPAQLGAE